MHNAPHAQRVPPSAGGLPGTPADPPQSLLRMAVGDEVVAVGIEDVREILQVTRMTPLPRTPEFVRGVMNLRGAVVPVVDLAARLGRPAAVIGRRSCIVVVDCHPDARAADSDDGDDGDDDPVGRSWVMGLLVDAVFDRMTEMSAAELRELAGFWR